MSVQALKTAWSFAFDRIGHYDRRLHAVSQTRRWFIPMYHRILRNDEADPFDFGLGVSERYFDQHLAFFRIHFHVCTVAEGLAIHQSGDWPDRPLLSITFDDGYLDNHQRALPLLQQHGCNATFFISTGAIIDAYPFWWDLVMASALSPSGPHWQALLASLDMTSGRSVTQNLCEVLAHLWNQPYQQILAVIDLDLARRQGLDQRCPARMSTHQVKELSDHGMEVAAHTHHHPNLTKETDQRIEDELVRSKALIETWTEKPVIGFAPPHGFVDDRVKSCCADHGIAYIASTDRGSNPLLEPNHLERFGIANAGVPTLKRSLVNAIG